MFILEIVTLLLKMLFVSVFHMAHGGTLAFAFAGIMMLIGIIFFMPWNIAVLLEQYQDLKLRHDRKLKILPDKLNKMQQAKA